MMKKKKRRNLFESEAIKHVHRLHSGDSLMMPMESTEMLIYVSHNGVLVKSISNNKECVTFFKY